MQGNITLKCVSVIVILQLRTMFSIFNERRITRTNKLFELSQEELDVIATYMDDDIRESVSFDLSPCTPNQFLREYVSRDEHFEELLKSEFGIEMR